MDKINYLIEQIQSVLTDDLLSSDWKRYIRTGDFHPTTGHCYAASEALYHLLGGKEKGYTPQVGKSANGTHWWLEDKNENILDPTAEQFYYKGNKPPYETGRGNGFLTKFPSKRAQKIIEEIKYKNIDIS